MRVKKILKRLYYFLKPKEEKYKRGELCGVSLELLQGTLRAKADQDDAWWFYLTKHHSAIYDVGANIGYTALLALIQDPNRQIILVDPNPQALQKAAMNIIQNSLGSRAQYLTAFVGDTLDDTVKFYTIGAGAAGSMYASHAETASSMNSSMDVKTVTLDSIFDHYGLQPDLVKIDVEGAETLVMKAAKKLANQTQCTFFIEMHDVEHLGMEASGDFMIDWCNAQNYQAWYLKTGEQLTTGKMIADRGKCHLLLIPKGQAYPEYLKGVSQNSALPKSF
ncbi:FkbM family methyltransferase [Psychroserpens algicola]|uniref:FkbM family methyltransferase n=1 Tax=Psychroserpens algicola TaxID=1719034 RepID=A0ABT0H590_9FLAO|nr:FkbM family methyltransferase [Psychroserpens algicola]MCK8479554.1 FkbM family methyltransferase [Psychroserpens algicola]